MLFLFVLVLFASIPVFAQSPAFKSTPYPVPRFVTLGSQEVNVRSGPGKQYPVQYMYRKKGLPVEIILEFEAWRKIKDSEGNAGWVHNSLLSGKRSALLQNLDDPDGYINLRRKAREDAKVLVGMEPEVVVTVHSCKDAWCHIDVAGYKGFVLRKSLWGVYPDENFD